MQQPQTNMMGGMQNGMMQNNMMGGGGMMANTNMMQQPNMQVCCFVFLVAFRKYLCTCASCFRSINAAVDHRKSWVYRIEENPLNVLNISCYKIMIQWNFFWVITSLISQKLGVFFTVKFSLK